MREGGLGTFLLSKSVILRSVSLFHGICDAQDLGIRELNGDSNKSEAALADIEAFGASIK